MLDTFLIVGDRAFGEVGVGGLQSLAHGFETHAVAVQLRGIYFHADGGTRAAPDEDLTDTVNLRELLREDGVGGVVNLRRRNIFGGEREEQDGRVGGIYFSIGGLAGQVGGQLAARGVDGGLNIASGGVDVAAQIKLESDAGAAEAAGGSHLGDAGDAAELALERSGHRGGHSFRAGAGQACAHGNGREIHLRQRGNGQKPESDSAG